MLARLLPALGPRIKPAMFFMWRFTRGMTLGVRCAVFDDQDRVCLVRHTYTPGWHFPGGGVEPGETALEAVAKELHEEAGIETRADPELFSVYANFSASYRDHVLLYVVRDWVSHDLRLPTREIAEMAFCPMDDLPADVSPGTRRRLSEISNGREPARTW